MGIQFLNLNCRLGGKEIIRNISGEVLHGKVTAILGANGCGKSTWLRALLGLVSLESGTVTGVSKSVGYLPQKKEIYWPLTCEAIINLSPASHTSTMLSAGEPRATKVLDSILKRLSIQHLREKRIDEVSGGERTLVLLARALRGEPDLIIADEPVSELDPKYQVKVMQILKEEAARGAIVLVTMHDIQLTQRFCDEVFLMKKGQIMKSGSVEQIITKENLAEIFETPFSAKLGRGLSPDGD